MSCRITLALFGGVSLLALSSPALADYQARTCVAGRGLERSVRALLAEAEARTGTPGMSVSVFDQDRVTATATAGVRSLNALERIGVSDAFGLGSNTKHLLAVSMAQLVDQGRLSYSDRLGDLLPEFAPSMRAEYRDATVGQLLTMTAGLGGYNRTDPEADMDFMAYMAGVTGDAAEHRRKATEYFLQTDPLYAPGEAQLYSNAGFVVLGAVYERLTGRPYEEAAIASTFGRVGARAGFGIPRDLGRNNPSLHMVSEDGQSLIAIDDPHDAVDVFSGRLPISFNSTGGMVATMPAFAEVERRLLRAAMNLPQELASNGALQGLFQPVGGGEDGMGMGGLLTSTAIGETTHFFVGETLGGSAYVFLAPESGVGVVLATNTVVDLFAGGLVESEEEAYRLLARLAARARLGVLNPQSADQATVFGAVEALCLDDAADRSTLSAMFGELTATQASALAEQITPDDSRAIDVLSAAPLQAMSDQLESRMSPGGYAFRGRTGRTGGGWRAFAAGGSLDDRFAADAAGPGRRVDGWATTAGFDLNLTEQLRVGWALGYGEARTGLPGRDGEARLTSTQMAVTAAFDEGGGLFADGRAVIARQPVTTRRAIAIDGMDFGEAEARRNALGLLVDATAGYSFGDRLRLAPFAGLRFVATGVEAVDETDSDLALKLEDRWSRRLDARAGLSLATRFDVADFIVRPSVEGYYSRTVHSRRNDIVARFDEGGPAMRFEAAPLDRNTSTLRAAVDVERGPVSLQVGAAQVFERRGGGDLTWSATARFAF